MQLVSILDFSIPFMFSRKAICIVIYNIEIVYNTRVFITQRWWLGVGSPRIAW
jgi:hypothetical protein